MSTKEISLKMTQHWLKLKEWWNALAIREKQAVALGGLLLTIFIAYAGIWSPFAADVSDMRDRIQSQEKVLTWMQAAVA